MGIDISASVMSQLFESLDHQGSGSGHVVEESDFPQLYQTLLDHFLNDGLELQRLRDAFFSSDEDNVGVIPVARFTHVLKKLCRNQLTTKEINAVVDIADINKDGNVSFEEFLWLVQHTNTGSLEIPEAQVLLRKVLRMLLPDPLERTKMFEPMPSHFRPSALARFDYKLNCFTSAKLSPLLDFTGMNFKHFNLHPVEKCLAYTPPGYDIDMGKRELIIFSLDLS
jgi:Ca2+-binding EF-hand superfamily protein